MRKAHLTRLSLFLLLSALVAGCSQGVRVHRAAENRCERIQAMASRLVLRRVDNVPRRFVKKFVFAPITSSNNREQVRAVASALCSLPVLPDHVALACSGGVEYTMTFFADTGQVGVVTFQGTGCDAVFGLGGRQPRIYRPQSRLWPVLGQAIGVRNPTFATFEGSKVQPASSG